MINASADWIGTTDSFTMFYCGHGNVMIEIGEFEKRGQAVVLLEQTTDGGAHWQPFHAAKHGRGMNTNATDKGPCMFRGQLEPGRATGIRVRCQDTPEMKPIPVRITFAGGIGAHIIHTDSSYTIDEVPDLRDLITEERS